MFVLWLGPGLTAAAVHAQVPAAWTVSDQAVELGSGADELFESVRYGRFLDDGRVVVADAGGAFLRVYAADGRREVEMGRRGEGPGEFLAINGLWITPEGQIGVWGARTFRVTIFDPSGDLIDTHPVWPEGAVTAGSLDPFLGSFRNGDVLLGALSLQMSRSEEGTFERWVMGRFASWGEYLGSPGEILGMLRAGRGPVPFTPVPRVAIREDSIWVVAGFEPEIEVWSAAGNLVRTIALPWKVNPSGDPWSTLRAELSRRDLPFFLELLAEAPRSDRFPLVGGLLFDDLGYLWVKVYDIPADSVWLKRNALMVSPGGEWWVLSPEGYWVARVEMPEDVTPLDFKGDRLLGVRRDALDVERVVIHQVIR